MADAPAVARSRNGKPAPSRPDPADAGRQELARTLQQKLAQGYEIESESDDRAVLVMKGRRRWFGLSNSASVRYEVTIDDGGQPTSRRI